jgi:hypothetical protein
MKIIFIKYNKYAWLKTEDKQWPELKLKWNTTIATVINDPQMVSGFMTEDEGKEYGVRIDKTN